MGDDVEERVMLNERNSVRKKMLITLVSLFGCEVICVFVYSCAYMGMNMYMVYMYDELIVPTNDCIGIAL